MTTTTTALGRAPRGTTRFVLMTIVCALLVAVFVGPLWAVLSTAFDANVPRPGQLSFWPGSFTTDHLTTAWSDHNVWRYFLNSVVVVSVALFLQVTISALAAYALARKKFRASSAILFVILTTMMLPEEVIAIPLYLTLRDMPVLGVNLLNSHAGMILPVVGWAFSIFVLTQFMREIPLELEESARMDGAGDLRIFVQIIIPLVRPALATVTVFGFLMIWDQYLLPLIVAQDTEMLTLPVALRALRQNDLVSSSVLMAAALIALVPTIAVYLGMQRHFTRGLTSGAIKG
jgi:multiple sugar transport system permease protein